MGRPDPAMYWSQQPATIQSMFCGHSETLFREEKAEIMEYLHALQTDTILDLASGIGRFTRFFSNRCQRVLSVDFTPAFVDKNRQDHADCQNVEFVCSNALDLDIPKRTIDFVFCNWLCMYLTDREVSHILEKIHAWLKPRGELFCRESCNLVRVESEKKGYFAIYRTLGEYDAFFKKQFTIIHDNHLKSYVYERGNPFQCYWHCRKDP